MMNNCNLIVSNHLALIGGRLGDHTTLVLNLKRDLDSVYSRIRKLKNRLKEKYPEEVENAEKEELEKMPLPENE